VGLEGDLQSPSRPQASCPVHFMRTGHGAEAEARRLRFRCGRSGRTKARARRALYVTELPNFVRDFCCYGGVGLKCHCVAKHERSSCPRNPRAKVLAGRTLHGGESPSWFGDSPSWSLAPYLICGASSNTRAQLVSAKSRLHAGICAQTSAIQPLTRASTAPASLRAGPSNASSPTT